MTMAFWLRSVLVAVGLFVVQVVLHRFSTGETGGSPEGASVLPWVLLSNLLVALVLVHLAERSPAAGRSLVGLLFAVAFGIPALYLLETVFFDIGVDRTARTSLYAGAVVGGLAAGLLAAGVCGKLRGGPAAALRAVPLRAGRAVAGTLAYVLVYFVAGMLAWPFLRAYYETRPMPPVGTVLALQIVRGGLLVLLVWWMSRHEPAGRRAAALDAGLALSVIGGIAPLVIPGNPYLPDSIRLVHLVEVGVSNFVFGAVAALLLDRDAPAPVTGG